MGFHPRCSRVRNAGAPPSSKEEIVEEKEEKGKEGEGKEESAASRLPRPRFYRPMGWWQYDDPGI